MTTFVAAMPTGTTESQSSSSTSAPDTKTIFSSADGVVGVVDSGCC